MHIDILITPVDSLGAIPMSHAHSETTTENSITDLIASYLRASGLKVSTQVSIVGTGARQQPDFRLEYENKVFYGEAKWIDNYWQGVGQAYDYVKIEDASGAFAIGYPSELKAEVKQQRLDSVDATELIKRFSYRAAFLHKDKRPTEYFRGNLDEFSKWIVKTLAGKKVEIEPDVSEMIDILQQTVDALASELGLSKRSGELFRNVIGGNPDKEDEDIISATRNAAAYLLVNQLTFYRVLSSTGKYPEIRIDAIVAPWDLQDKYFNKVLNDNYTPVFGARVSVDFSPESVERVHDAIRTIYGITPERIERDVLGKVFHRLIPLALRKEIAAYYTLSEVAELLATLAIDEPGVKVIDPACGSGTLLVSAYRRKRQLLEAERKFGEDDHKRFVQHDITGIDVMPFAGHLSVIHLALQEPIYETEEVSVGIADSTRLRKGTTIKAFERILPEAEQGQKRIQSFLDASMKAKEIDRDLDLIAKKEIEIGEYDLVIMNPPFTRFQRIAGFGEEYTERLLKRFSAYKELLDGRMGYYAYFLLVADKLLKDGGRVAAVLPNTMLRGHATEKLREFLVSNYDLEYIIVREDKINFSEDTQFREVLLIAAKRKTKTNKVSFVVLKELNPELSSKIKRARERTQHRRIHEDAGFMLQNINQSTVRPSNLYEYVSLSSYELLNLWKDVEEKDVFVPLSERNFEIRSRDEPDRGGPTFGKFCINRPSSDLMASEVWEFVKQSSSKITARHRITKELIELPRDSVVPAFRRLSYGEAMNQTAVQEYVLFRPFASVDRFTELSDVEDVDWHQWSDYVKSRMSHLAVGARFDISSSGTGILAFYSDEERAWSRATTTVVKCDDIEEAKVLAVWYNSIFNIVQLMVKRKETRGAWMEVNKFVLVDFLVPEVAKLGTKKKRLLDAFGKLSGKKMPSLVEQLALNTQKSVFAEKELGVVLSAFKIDDIIGQGFGPRMELDEAVAEALSIEVDLRTIYGKTLYEIAKLKRMMA